MATIKTPFSTSLGGWKVRHRTAPHQGPSQDVVYHAAWTRLCGGPSSRREVVVQIDIRRNAYNAQSYARLQALDPATLTWSTLVTLAQPEMMVLLSRAAGTGNQKIDVVNYMRFDRDQEGVELFAKDEEALLKRAAVLIDAALN